MHWIVEKIRPIMLVSGALTCTMLYAAIAPEAALHSTFGETMTGPLVSVVVRNWGVLITLVGVMPIHGAFRPASRRLVLAVAIASKLCFIGLILVYGRQFLAYGVGAAIAIDSVMVLLFVAYLAAAPRPAAVPGGHGRISTPESADVSDIR
jgi:hypothetical protein